MRGRPVQTALEWWWWWWCGGDCWLLVCVVVMAVAAMVSGACVSTSVTNSCGQHNHHMSASRRSPDAARRYIKASIFIQLFCILF